VKRRSLIAYSILAVWVIVAGVHARREYFKPLAVQLAEGARLLGAGSHFYVVRMNDAAIGIASTRFDTIAGGYVLEDMTTLDVPALDASQRAVTRTSIDLGPALDVRGFRYTLDSSVGRFAVQGSVRDDELDITLDAGGGAQRNSVRVGEGVLLEAVVPLRLAAAGLLEAGREVNVRVFDPSTLEPRTATVRVVRRASVAVSDSVIWTGDEWRAGAVDTIPGWLLEQQFAGVTIRSWVDGDGLLLRAESALGFTIERTAYELAQQAWNRTRAAAGLASGYGVVIESTAIASNVDVTASPSHDAVRVRLLGVELDGFDLDGGRQQLRGDTLTVRREALPIDAGYSLPYRGGEVPAETLAPSALVQADDHRIIEAAHLAVRGARDPLVAALRLNEWIYRHVDKDLVLSVPSAVQVLKERRGDCNEHTVLFVAMARALGLPARTAAGLVQIRGRFYYHAWPEVWLGEWVAFDPTLGQAPADASHLRFVIGGLARQVELARLIGRLRLEVL
jgi:transglutaminase-like putative cysteine protease